MKPTTALLLLSAMVLFSCNNKIILDDEVDIPVVNSSGDTVVDPVKGTLLYHENFQKWSRDGYFLTSKLDCETDLMKSVNVVSYLPNRIKVIYDSLTVNYALVDYAVNPECGNSAGVSTVSSEVSLGYVALQCPMMHVACYHYTNGYLEISVIPSVSYIEFTVSYGDNSENGYAGGVSLWKKSETDPDTIKIGTYIPHDPLKGEKFTVKIDSKNVILKIKAEKKSTVTLGTEKDTPLVNRSVRIHDLFLWKPKIK
ncbi:MAG: hypothetical protein Q8928_16985 [Bacteroidota bacterium]|nr:hypothetical protein [Bacteroidota bacterium]